MKPKILNFKLLFFLILFFGLFGLAKSSWASCDWNTGADCYTIITCPAGEASGAVCRQPNYFTSDSVAWATYGAAPLQGGGTDVQAKAGDVAIMKAGTYTYTHRINLGTNHASRLYGQGSGSTIIDANGTTDTTMVQVDHNTPSSYNIKIKGFKITGTMGSSGASTLVISLDGNPSDMVISDIEYAGDVPSDAAASFLFWIGSNAIWDLVYQPPLHDANQRILINNIKFTSINYRMGFARAYGRSWKAWREDDNWGNSTTPPDFIIIENSTINYNYGPTSYGAVWDSEAGAKLVFRYNDVTNGWFTYHDFANYRDRGSRAFEVYNNKWTCTMTNYQGCAAQYPLHWRGGTGLMYNNSSTGYYVPFGIEIFRVAYPNCQTSGTTTMCEDWWPHCGPNSSTPGAICYFTPSNPNNGVVDCSDHSCDYTGCTAGFGGCKDAEGKSMYCIQIDGGGSGNYPCRDQQGRGKETLPAGTEALQPLYYWNNYFNGSPTSLSGSLGYSSDYIQQNREYCNQSPNDPTGSCSKASWSYTPATCPDPRAGVSGTCAADQYGRDGYPTASSDVTPPAAPTGLTVN